MTEPGAGRLVLTPTWDVLAMYAAHHGARRLPVHSDAVQHVHDGLSFPAVSATASLAADGSVNLTVCNTDPAAPAEVDLSLASHRATLRSASLLASPVLNACNTFDQPRTITTRPFDGVRATSTGAAFTLPPGSVAALRFA